MPRRRLIPLVALFAGMTAAAQEPSAGTVAGPFRAFVAADYRTTDKNPRNRTAKMHDLVTENGLNPFVVVFSRTTPKDAEAPLVKLLKALDNQGAKHKADRLGAFAVFLTLAKEYPEDDQRDEKAKAVGDLANQLKAQFVPFAVAAGATDQTKAWGLTEAADVTVMLVDRLKVAQTWTFTADKPPAAEDVKKITDAIEAALKK